MMFYTGGDDEATAATSNEGGKQRGEDRHQHLRLKHWHTQVMWMIKIKTITKKNTKTEIKTSRHTQVMWMIWWR